MINGTLYMKFASDQDYFEVSILPMAELSTVLIDNQPNSRFQWGELSVRNKPYNYGISALNKDKLYDLIMQQSPTSEIKIKFISDEYPLGIEGYFGKNDCEPNNDTQTITIKPTILDQYTPIIENRDTEVELYADHNIVRNPTFATVTNIVPDEWIKYQDLKAERIWLNNATAVKIYDGVDYRTDGIHYVADWNANTNTPELVDGIGTAGDYLVCTVAGTFKNRYYSVDDTIIYDGSVWNVNYAPFPEQLMSLYQLNTANIFKNKQCKFAFNYFLSGSSSRQKELYCDVFLSDPLAPTVNYRLDKDGNWSDAIPILTETNPFRYSDAKRTPIPITSFDKYRTFSVITKKTPVAGNIEIIFYRPVDDGEWDSACSLILTNIEFSASELELKTINVRFSPENMVTSEQGESPIQWDSKAKNGDDEVFYKYGALDTSFEAFIGLDGVPVESMLNNKDLCPTSVKNLTYGDLITIFDSNPTVSSYKFELSKLTIFKGEARGWGKHRDWWGVAEFTREQIVKTDPIMDNTTGFPITSNSNVNNYRPWQESDGYEPGKLPPPEFGVGWSYMQEFIPAGSSNRLWVRKPFNGLIQTWNRGEVITGDKRPYKNRFMYWDSLTTTRAYPIDESKSFTIDTAIDLRELIRKVYCESSPELIGKNVYSSFFWNDCENVSSYAYNPTIAGSGYLNLTGKNSGSNYVTMTDSSKDVEPKNTLSNIVAIHTYDLLNKSDQKYGDEKSVLKLSFKKLIEDLNVLFRQQLYFFVDLNLNLFIEHIKYFDRTNTPINLTEPRFSYIRKKDSWKYDNSKMFSLEEFKILNAGYSDFKTSNIVFDKMPSNKRGEDIKASYSTQVISTDIQYCKENATGLDNGIVLLAYDVVNGENKSRYGTGQKTGRLVINGDLSISSLIAKYGSYEGTWTQGKINDRGITESNPYYPFALTKRSREGVEIIVKGILTNDLIITNIGRGLIKSKSIDYNKQLTKITAIYRQSDNWSGLDMGDQEQVFELAVVNTNAGYIIISNTEVNCIGQLISSGGTAVTENGICYSTNPLSVSTADTKVVGVESIGYFTSSLTGLSDGTIYYYRAYAINSVGTSYGNISNFVISLPVVSIDGIITLGDNDAEILSEVIAIGTSAVIARGVCYSSISVPDIDDLKTVDGSGIGVFKSSLTGLTDDTWYNLRAYATNSSGTSYSNKIRLKTLIVE